MPTTIAGSAGNPDNRCFAQAVPRTSALQHAAQLSPVERSYVAKYPGESGAAIKAVCQELLERLAAANAQTAALGPSAGNGRADRLASLVIHCVAGPPGWRPISRAGSPMPSTVFDSAIFRDAFGSPAMREVFSDAAAVARYVEVEVALAAVEGRARRHPQGCRDAIAKRADANAHRSGRAEEKTDVVGYPIVGLVSQLAKQCGDAGRYLHWGATTQDIMDTGLVLQVRDALALVEADLVGYGCGAGRAGAESTARR